MVENVLLSTTGILQGVGQHGKTPWVEVPGGQVAVIVGSMSQTRRGRSSPGRIETDRTEGVADNLAKDWRKDGIGVEVRPPLRPGR